MTDVWFGGNLPRIRSLRTRNCFISGFHERIYSTRTIRNGCTRQRFGPWLQIQANLQIDHTFSNSDRCVRRAWYKPSSPVTYGVRSYGCTNAGLWLQECVLWFCRRVWCMSGGAEFVLFMAYEFAYDEEVSLDWGTCNLFLCVCVCVCEGFVVVCLRKICLYMCMYVCLCRCVSDAMCIYV